MSDVDKINNTNNLATFGISAQNFYQAVSTYGDTGDSKAVLESALGLGTSVQALITNSPFGNALSNSINIKLSIQAIEDDRINYYEAIRNNDPDAAADALRQEIADSASLGSTAIAVITTAAPRTALELGPPGAILAVVSNVAAAIPLVTGGIDAFQRGWKTAFDPINNALIQGATEEFYENRDMVYPQSFKVIPPDSASVISVSAVDTRGTRRADKIPSYFSFTSSASAPFLATDDQSLISHISSKPDRGIFRGSGIGTAGGVQEAALFEALERVSRLIGGIDDHLDKMEKHLNNLPIIMNGQKVGKISI